MYIFVFCLCLSTTLPEVGFILSITNFRGRLRNHQHSHRNAPITASIYLFYQAVFTECLDIPIRKTLCILTAMGRHFSKARVVGLSSSVAVKVCTPTSILICGIAASSLCSSSAGPCGSCFTEPDKFRPLTQVGTAERSVASAKRLPASKRLGPTYGD